MPFEDCIWRHYIPRKARSCNPITSVNDTPTTGKVWDVTFLPDDKKYPYFKNNVNKGTVTIQDKTSGGS